MKKSTLLSLATAGAIVMTSVGTYALWDTTKVDTTGTLGFEAPVTLTATNLTFDEQTTRTLNVKPVASSEVTFTVTDTKKRATELDLSAKVKNGGTDVTDKVEVTFEKDGTALANDKDTSLAAGGANKYTVKVTPTDAATSTELSGNLDVTVTGELK